jgi:hypothetical protein
MGILHSYVETVKSLRARRVSVTKRSERAEIRPLRGTEISNALPMPGMGRASRRVNPFTDLRQTPDIQRLRALLPPQRVEQNAATLDECQKGGRMLLSPLVTARGSLGRLGEKGLRRRGLIGPNQALRRNQVRALKNQILTVRYCKALTGHAAVQQLMQTLLLPLLDGRSHLIDGGPVTHWVGP